MTLSPAEMLPQPLDRFRRCRMRLLEQHNHLRLSKGFQLLLCIHWHKQDHSDGASCTFAMLTSPSLIGTKVRWAVRLVFSHFSACGGTFGTMFEPASLFGPARASSVMCP